jgi:flagellar biosynthetic protein FlhB
MAEELGERTELPTGRKLSRARSEGNIAKSADFSAAIDLSGSFIALLVLGPGLVATLAAILRSLLDARGFSSPDSLEGVGVLLRFAGSRGVQAVLPFLGALFVVSLVAQFIQVGWLWTYKPLHPKLQRLNPINGAKKLLGKNNLIKLSVNSVKLAVVGSVAVGVSWGNIRKLSALPALDALPALAVVGNILISMLVWVLFILLVIGIIDYAFQRWNRIQKLRMTKQEVKDEIKSMEGDLQTKARRLRAARDMLYQQMAAGVKSADVIVTNPTHFAVALKYDAGKMHAPKVVAKGADYMALRIRQLAREAGVPIVEKPPLARALYRTTEVGRSIAPEFYQAVAELLAYVYRLKGRAA